MVDMATPNIMVGRCKSHGAIKKQREGPKLPEGAHRDIYCWVCHKFSNDTAAVCDNCPRLFHIKCLNSEMKIKLSSPKTFNPCPVCSNEEIRTAVPITRRRLSHLLSFAIRRMRDHPTSYWYDAPVKDEDYPDYKNYIINPMSITQLEIHVKNRKYSSCASFIADAEWIYHNSLIFDHVYEPVLIGTAKAVVKIAKEDANDIQSCPDCFHRASLSCDTWYLEVCNPPHILVWAKYNKFPYWPGKILNNGTKNVTVWFFGTHDKAVVPHKNCYLYSDKFPMKPKLTNSLQKSIQEIDLHAQRLKKKFPLFCFPETLTPLTQSRNDQFQLFFPKVIKIKSLDTVNVSEEGQEQKSHREEILKKKQICPKSVKERRQVESKRSDRLEHLNLPREPSLENDKKIAVDKELTEDIKKDVGSSKENISKDNKIIPTLDTSCKQKLLFDLKNKLMEMFITEGPINSVEKFKEKIDNIFMEFSEEDSDVKATFSEKNSEAQVNTSEGGTSLLTVKDEVSQEDSKNQLISEDTNKQNRDDLLPTTSEDPEVESSIGAEPMQPVNNKEAPKDSLAETIDLVAKGHFEFTPRASLKKNRRSNLNKLMPKQSVLGKRPFEESKDIEHYESKCKTIIKQANSIKLIDIKETDVIIGELEAILVQLSDLGRK